MAGEIYDWSVTAADNATSDATVNWAEGQLPSTVNNSARAMMASVASLVKDIGGTVTTGGSANAHTFTSNVDVSALATGQMFVAKAGFTNTAAATMNYSGTSAKAIKRYTSAGEADLTAGDIRASGIYHFVYDAAANSAAGAWMLLNPTGNILAPDGSAAGPYVPSITFAADTDNGMVRSGANAWSLVTGGAVSIAFTTSLVSINNNLQCNTSFTVNYTTGAVAFAGDLAINTSAFTVDAVTGNTASNGYGQFNQNDATPAGGSANVRLSIGSGAIGHYIGTGDPTVSAAKGSIYVRTDATTTTSRLWINTDGATAWTYFTSNS
jgi:hypothetical protein